MIRRGRLKFRYDLSNGVCLCVSHHGATPMFRNRRIAAHGSGDVKDRFDEWLEAERSGVWMWCILHGQDMRMPEKTYQECYKELKGFEGR